MHIRTFDWDERNVDHIARHDVEPHEAEAVCRGRTVVFRGRAGSYLVYGRTSDGRHLLIVLRPLEPGRARVITARDLTPSERRLYERRR